MTDQTMPPEQALEWLECLRNMTGDQVCAEIEAGKAAEAAQAFRAALEADEKPVASIKTLARYEPDIVYIGTGEYVAECVRADDGDYYLAADVDAAIEALRAEMERLRTALNERNRVKGATYK